MIDLVLIQFAGSFQCRLAVGSSATNDSPPDPYRIYGNNTKGGTFSYKERKFDRIIRLSKPIDLRNALIDPWEDTKVKAVWLYTGKGLQAVSGNPLIGQVVSLGSSVKFSEADPVFWNLIDFKLSIGADGLFLVADRQTGPPETQLVDGSSQLVDEYKSKKTELIPVTRMDPVRKRVLEDPVYFEAYASQFKRIGHYPFILLVPGSVRLFARFDGYDKMDLARSYIWTLFLRFERWDGDTLTGRVSGDLFAVHQSVLKRMQKTVGEVVGEFLKSVAYWR
jgi:hypothetical protein